MWSKLVICKYELNAVFPASLCRDYPSPRSSVTEGRTGERISEWEEWERSLGIEMLRIPIWLLFFLNAIIDSRLFKMKYDPSRDKVPIIEGGGRGGDPGRACVGIK